MTHPHTIHTISSGWEFKQHHDPDDPDAAPPKIAEWLPVDHLPSEVHTELQRHGKIPDPHVGLNELEVRWVGEQAWIYRTTFPTPPEVTTVSSTAKAELVFKGLDTFATVTLNGEVILRSDNMFVEHRVDVGRLLLSFPAESENNLEIIFEPARRRGLELVAAHPEHDFIVHQTEVSRGPVRKAQCHWGWDWGPIILTCGPWKPAQLEVWTVRVEDVRAEYAVDLSGGREAPTVEVAVSATILGAEAMDFLEVEVWFGGEVVVQFRGYKDDEDKDNDDVNIPAAEETPPWTYTSPKFTIPDPQLWYPRGYGPANLYELRLRAISAPTTDKSAAAVLAETHQTIGFRTVELVQEKDTPAGGQSFYLRINAIPIFSGGSCWIPADTSLATLTPARYRAWIALLAAGNQNMIRVWGGGVYESDEFYAACDELGVLVWQDFMFACASYPTYPEYLASVETEARQNVRRLRSHPSLVIWCGNNEDYQIVERYGLEYRYEEDKDPEGWLGTNWPGRFIYEELLPRVVREEMKGMGGGQVVYHPGSPWGNGTSTTLKVDANVGDIHQWNIWHGEMRPYQQLPQMGGRFVSEFGMEGYPHLDTIDRFLVGGEGSRDRYPGSRTMDFHNKAVGHERRLLTYLGENFRIKYDMKGFAHLTQVMQADAVSWAYRGWRRQWGTQQNDGKVSRGCGGVLVWQLNDCWPTVSWAVVDYYLVKKPAYYAIKRALAPLAVGVVRKFHDWTTRPADELWKRDTGHVDLREAVRDVVFDVWVASARLEPVQGLVVIRFISAETGEDEGQTIEEEVTVLPNGTTEVFSGLRYEGADEKLKHVLDRGYVVIHASLLVGGEEVASDTSWPDPIKYLDFADRGVKVKYLEKDLVEVSAEKPVKGFVFAERQGVTVSNNGFDVMPREKAKQVRITRDDGADMGELAWTFVGQ
ncbi:glycoside hydrolase family 2 protein [Bombardia bombarda]|uniref:Beta-mannosidase B n=1 Tax=Bombardia bombarda TaxID=252184 RepID=A0AA40C7U4_9PEZI|nr:glycoside hydrolase family 2 protein [Bombardia bombarda]